ncbi:MAG TPA: ABC transporter substrate-binding protein [Polyangia bacterium]
MKTSAAPPPRSARDVVRIGTTKMLPAGAAILSYGGRPYYKSGDVPDYLEALPNVSSDAVRFLADGALAVRWRLKANLRWSDGQPVTAHDVEFACRAEPHPQLQGVRVENEREVVLTWKDRLAEGFKPPGIYPRHALEQAFASGGLSAMEKLRQSAPTPGLGPYRAVDFVDGQRVRLERNPHFPGMPAAIRRVEVVAYETGAALTAAFERGEIDITAPNALSVEEALDLNSRRPDAVTIRATPQYSYLQPDITHPLLGRRDVRRAILMAIDRDALAREVHGGLGTVAHTPTAGAPPAGAVIHRYDLKAARDVLVAAGAAGTAIPLYHRAVLTEQRSAERVAADLRAVGLNIEMRPVSMEQYFSLWRERRHGGLLFGVSQVDEETPATSVWNLPERDGWWDVAARNEAFDNEVAELAEREAHALYPERRAQLRAALFARYSDRLPNLPLTFGSERLVADPCLQGREASPGSPLGRGIHRWYFLPAAVSQPAPASGPARDRGDLSVRRKVLYHR